MSSNLFMYLAAMSAVSIHNLANNIKEATRSYNSFDLNSTNSTDWTLSDTNKLIRVFPKCNGTRQSPISIDGAQVLENSNLRLGLTAYERPISGFLVNQFPTFRLVPFSYEWPRPSALVSQSYARSFNPYADSHFSLSHVEFHWLPENEMQLVSRSNSMVEPPDAPSLHRLNGTSYAAEIHFVHTNTAYSSLDEANQKADGLLIFAVLAVPSTHESYIFDRLLDELVNLTEHKQQVGFNEDSTWRSLLPQDTSRFYRYFGSTLMPPCHESVQWIIFDEKLKLGQKQLRRLRRFRFLSKDSTTGRAVDWSQQMRPLQSVNNRTVERSFRPQFNPRATRTKLWSS